MFGFAFGFAATIVGLAARLGLAFALLALKVSFAIGKGLFKVLAGTGQGVGRLAAKGYKALAAARKRRLEAKRNAVAAR